MAGSRRDILRIGVIVGVAALVMARPWQGLREPEVTLEEIPGLAPLRRFSGAGDTSGGRATQAVFAGLDAGDEPSEAERAAAARLRANPCGALGLTWPEDGPLPITYFTDIRCPSCRRLEASLNALAEDDAVPLRQTTREFPVFGARSEAAARAIVAAAPQGADEMVRAHLRSRPAPETTDAARRMAGSLGLDADAYIDAWESPATTARLAEDRAFARALGLPGTPGLVIGRTVVLGVQPRETLRTLILQELEEGPPAMCT
jgi:predicted DsbA family dithiol-disulfide isomerase